MYKLLHISFDPKFFSHVGWYHRDDFQNTLIFFGEPTQNIIDKIELLAVSYEIFPKDSKSFEIIALKYDNFDGMILYSLTPFSQKLLDLFPKEFKIFWFFFGYEIYNRHLRKYISKKTYRCMPQSSLIYQVKHKLAFLRDEIKGKKPKVNLDREIYPRLTAILMLNEFEYKELQEMHLLPPFIKRPVAPRKKLVIREKKDLIIVGNSRNMWNNHLDVLEGIVNTCNQSIAYELFFSYGAENKYTEKVREIVDKEKNIHLIETFLDKETFTEKYKSAAALVINSFRQHAFGNIITGLRNGCKIYLNPRSSTFRWLTTRGFNISNVKDLKEDIENHNFKLSEEEQLHNIHQYEDLAMGYTANDYLDSIKFLLEK